MCSGHLIFSMDNDYLINNLAKSYKKVIIKIKSEGIYTLAGNCKRTKKIRFKNWYPDYPRIHHSHTMAG